MFKLLGIWFWMCVGLSILNMLIYSNSLHWYNLAASLFAGLVACWIGFSRSLDKVKDG